MNCTIITIGDELLIGQIIDTNSAYIAQKLIEVGIRVHRRIAISDNEAEIRNAISESWKTSEIIITTGGLGPTKDDITKKTIADMFQVGMKRDEKTYQHVRHIFESRQLPFLPINEAQADIPENATVLFNARGTAPGMWIEYEGRILVSLPGVSYEMEYLIETHVLTALKSKFELPSLYYSHIQTSGLGESFLAKKIASIEQNIPANISLAYLPSPMHVHLRLSGDVRQKNEIDAIAASISKELKEYVYDHSKSTVESLVLDKLMARNETISLAESCTGGYLAHAITNLEGASNVFIGGWNVYTNSFKHNELDISEELLHQYGAVSEECAKELQIQALKKTNSTYSIAVVGYLSISDIHPKKYAIIAIGSREKTIIKKLDLIYPRLKSKEAINKVAWVTLYREFLC